MLTYGSARAAWLTNPYEPTSYRNIGDHLGINTDIYPTNSKWTSLSTPVTDSLRKEAKILAKDLTVLCNVHDYVRKNFFPILDLCQALDAFGGGAHLSDQFVSILDLNTLMLKKEITHFPAHENNLPIHLQLISETFEKGLLRRFPNGLLHLINEAKAQHLNELLKICYRVKNFLEIFK